MDEFEIEIYKRYQNLIGFSPLQITPQKIHFEELIEHYDVFCFDGFGTLYNRGNFIYGNALEWYRTLRKKNKILRLVTNAASNTTDVLAQEAAERGFDFSESEVISSGSLLKNLSTEIRTKYDAHYLDEVFYIGRETGKRLLEKNQIKAVENPAFPVVAVSSNIITPREFDIAVEILKSENSLLLVLNADAWAPCIDNTRESVSGALAEKLRREAFEIPHTFYLGKPFPEIWKSVKETLPEKAKVLMVGDTLGTDIYGAQIAGFDSALTPGRNVPLATFTKDEKALNIYPNFELIV